MEFYMKKFIVFTLTILAFTVLCIYLTEKLDVLNLAELPLEASFTEQEGRLVFTWKRLPYPCFYKVETFSRTTGRVKGEPDYHLFKQEFTFKAAYEVPGTAIPTYYRVTAYGMFGSLNGPSEYVENPDYAEPVRPIPIFHYDSEAPASAMPYLVWHTVPGAVCYEVELLSGPPEQEYGTALSSQHHLYSNQQVYTNGWQADLKPFLNQEHLYWRVRAMNLQKEPIGEFSKAEPLAVDPSLPMPNKPLLNNFDVMPGFQQPLYPVYHWIPMHDITRYEVELMTTPPEEENNTRPSPHRVWNMVANDSFSCYDEYARPYAGEYYWRVRAIDETGKTIGTYSDTEEFKVADHATRALAGAFGDSITHGGGAVSYSPASLEYSYTTYLDFPVINLGRSGDTSHTSMLRFDSDVLPYQPLNLFILTGSNSLRADNISAQAVIADLSAIAKKCEQNHIRPIFLTLMPINPTNIYAAFKAETDPNWHQKMDEVNAYIRHQPYYIDLEPYFYDSSKSVMAPELATDGLHPDIYGKMLMAEIINEHQYLLKK